MQHKYPGNESSTKVHLLHDLDKKIQQYSVIGLEKIQTFPLIYCKQAGKNIGNSKKNILLPHSAKLPRLDDKVQLRLYPLHKPFGEQLVVTI